MSRVTKTKETILDRDGYQVVSKSESRRVVLYSEVYCRWFSEKWNKYFKALYGKDVNFTITPRAQPYFSPMDCRTHLDMLLQTLFPEPPVVIDATCGIGGDVVDTLMRLGPRQVFCVDYMAEEEHEVLYRNLKNVVEAFPKEFPAGEKTIEVAGDKDGAWEAKISIHQKTASSFLKQYGAHLKKQKQKSTNAKKIYKPPVTFMYADVSWNGQYLTDLTTEEQQRVKNVEENKVLEETNEVYGDYEETLENEATPEILMNYIAVCILKPAIASNVPINILCIKVRWEITQQKMQEYLQLHEDIKDHFVVLYSVQAIPNVPGSKLKIQGDRYIIVEGKNNETRKSDRFNSTKGMFHWIVLKNVEYHYISHDRSKLYEEAVVDSHAVYVQNGSIIVPFKPRYGDSMPFPTIKTTNEFEKLDATEKEQYTKIDPSKTWVEVELEDINTYKDKLNNLKGEYVDGTAEEKKETKKRIEKIFKWCKKYTEATSRGTRNAEQSKIDDAIKILKKMVEEINLTVNDGFKEVTKSVKSGSNKPPSRKGTSNLDERTLELLHQLQVIFET